MCIDLHQTGFVGKGSDHLQLIKFWPSCTSGKGAQDGAKKIWLRLTTASAQCLRLSEHFFHLPCATVVAVWMSVPVQVIGSICHRNHLLCNISMTVFKILLTHSLDSTVENGRQLRPFVCFPQQLRGMCDDYCLCIVFVVCLCVDSITQRVVDGY